MRASHFVWVKLLVRMDHLLPTMRKLRLSVKVLHGCWTVYTFFCKRMRLAIEGKEMELYFLVIASLESIGNKENQ